MPATTFHDPVAQYKQFATEYETTAAQLRRKRSWLSWSRLLSVVLAIVWLYWQWPVGSGWMVLPSVILVAVFLRLVVLSMNVQQQLQHVQQLLIINQAELRQLQEHHYKDRYDGAAYMPPNHAYAHDLDVFGEASLYQYLQRAESDAGRNTLAAWLLQPALPEELPARQAAVQQLAPQVAWRQHLQASGREHPVSAATAQKLQQWMQSKEDVFAATGWYLLRWVGPIVSIGLFTAYWFDYLPGFWFNLYLLVFFLGTSYISKLATPTWQMLGRMSKEINGLAASLKYVEQMQTGESHWLKQRQSVLVVNGEPMASKAVAGLNQLLNWFDYRLNPVVFIPLNILLFWDLQQMLLFAQWKKQHAAAATQWLQVLGEVEAASSLAALAYNMPHWCFPQMLQGHGSFEAKALGHPLIAADKRVVSDIDTQGVAQVNIITGSNMAGKSTFLRSVGLAMVMAQAGAPVCALHCRMSYMHVMSSMRIADNLAESTSTFYAELKKLKSIIDAVKAEQPVYLLLDEILRGTNSGDRHAGSAALIQQLIAQQACGMIATHDLALAELVHQYPNHIHNYHFDVQVSGEELYFDYQLKQGVCQSLNASILMKKIGIDM